MRLCTKEDYNKGFQWHMGLERRLGLAKTDKELVEDLRKEQGLLKKKGGS